MKQNETKRLRGFTLMEMIVVIAIIAVISAIMIPTMNSYLTRSRLNSSNANARVIFNSLQTICQEFEFTDRTSGVSMFYGPKTTSVGGIIGEADVDLTNSSIYFTAAGGQITKVFGQVIYDGSGVSGLPIYFNSGGSLDPDWLPPTQTVLTRFDNPSSTTTMMQRMNRLFEENGTVAYAAMVSNYQVMGVICADNTNSSYLGGYPYKSVERGGFEPGTTPATEAGMVPFNTVREWTMEDVIGPVNDFTYHDMLERYVESKS